MTESTDKSHCCPTRFPRKTTMFKRDSRKRTICFRKAIYFWYFFLRQVLELFLGSWFYAFLLLCFSCFSACLLLCFTCFFSFLLLCFPCFSRFSAFVLYLLLFFSASLLSLLLCFSGFVLLCLSASTIQLFLFFSHMFLLLYCPALSASLLPVFTASLFFLFSAVCKHPKWNPKDTLKKCW